MTVIPSAAAISLATLTLNPDILAATSKQLFQRALPTPYFVARVDCGYEDGIWL
jgi:hypothetical protein